MAQMNDKNIKQLLETLDESLPPQVNFDTEAFWQQLQPQITPKKRTYWGYGIAASLLLMLISAGIWVNQKQPATPQLAAIPTPTKSSTTPTKFKTSAPAPHIVRLENSKKKNLTTKPQKNAVAKVQEDINLIATPLAAATSPVVEPEKAPIPASDSNRVAATVENPPSTKVSSTNPAKQRWKVVHANELQTDPMERIHEQISTKKRHSPSEYAQQTHLFTIKIK